MTLFYIWKLIEKIYFVQTNNTKTGSVLVHQGLGVFVLAALTLYLGIDTTFTVGVSENITNIIFSGVTK